VDLPRTATIGEEEFSTVHFNVYRWAHILKNPSSLKKREKFISDVVVKLVFDGTKR
jgi:hypothetical protein